MRGTVLLAAALAVACDDPEVATKAASVLEHGMVEANAVCEVPFSANGSFCTTSFILRASLFLDGSSFVQCIPHAAIAGAGDYGIATFNDRADPVQAVGGPGGVAKCTLSEGEVIFSNSSEPCSRPESIETYCTGRNLEAFGVEP
jgi:hypothetical protein